MDSVHLSWQNDRRRAEFTLRPGRMSLVVDRLHHVDADGEGRILRAILGPSTWRRSYADRWVEIRSEALEGERFHIPYPAGPHEALNILLRIRSLVGEARRAAEGTTADALDRILGWEADLLADDGQRFRALYPTLGPLPPDQQVALVLRADADLSRHVPAVLAFLGKARPARHGVYLDGATHLEQVAAALQALPDLVGAGQPVAAALPSLEAADWEDLHSRGLERVYVPLEGVDPSGLPLAVSFIAPAPQTLEEADVLATRVNALELRPSDTVYTLEPSPYPYAAEKRMALRQAFHRFRQALRFPDNPAGPVVTHYPVLQSVY
jgi:hypothetical protein